MANTSDNLRRLYDNGLKYFNLPDFDAFSKDMQDETKRKRFYTNMQAHYNLPEFEQFSQDIGMIQPAQPAPAQPQAATPSAQPTVQAPQAPQPTAAEPAQPTVRTAAQPSSPPGWGWVDEAASQWTANAQPTVTTPSVQQPQRTITQADRLAVNTQLDPIMPEAEPTEGEVVRPKQVLHPALDGIVEDTNGQLTPQWRLNDGSLTTDREVAGREEGAARAWDTYSEMSSRMRRAGLDPNDDDDVRLQQSIDAGVTEETTRTILARAGINANDQDKAISWMREKGLDPNNLTHAQWYADGNMESITRYRLEKAEARLKELMEQRQQRDNERANSGSFLQQLGRNASPASSQAVRVPPRQMGITEDPLDTAIAEATAEVGALAKSLGDYEQTRDAAEGSWYGNIGRGVLHAVTDPDNWTFGLYGAGLNEAIQSDMVRNSIREDAEILSQQAGNPGFVYNSFRFIGDMMANPILLPGAGAAGKLTGKLATNLVNRTMLKGIAPNIAQRFLMSTAKGKFARYGIGALQSAGFFAAFDGLQDAREQLENGGYYDEEGLFHEGFSWAHVAGKSAHGSVIGGAMGVFGGAVGNFGDWAVKSIGRTALRPGSKAFAETATRAGQKLVAFEGESTIFAAEDIYRFQTMDNKEFDAHYAEQFGYADLTGDARDQAREAARNSLSWDAWTDSQANLLGIKIGGKLQHPIRAFRSASETINRLRQKDEREHRTLPERITMMMERSPFDVALTKDELEEIQSKYGDIADLLRKIPRLDGALVKSGEQKIPGYEEFNQLIDDKSISQSARIKAYYIVTGRLLPISKITGMRYQKDTDTGRVTLETLGTDGELVSRSTYRDEEEARGDIQGARRQIKLNLVELGENNRQREEFDARLREACIAVAAERNFPIDGLYATVARAIESERSGVRLTEEQQAVVDMVREKIGEFEMAAVTDEIRNRINEQYDVDIDEALRKQPYEVSNTERSAIEDYINELWHQKSEREYVDYEEQKQPGNGTEPPANGPQPPTGEGPNGPGEGPVRPEDAAAAEVMRRTHKGTGKVIRATLKVDDRVVYIVDGEVSTFEDGSVHVGKSEDTLVVYDPESSTGLCEFISPDQILRVDEPRDGAVETEEVLRSMQAQASQEAPQEAQSAQPVEAYQEAPAEAPREYTAGFAKIRTEDGKERYIYLTGYPTEDGTYEYYFADKRDDLLYATKEQLDNMVIEFTPYEVKKETTQEAAEDPSAQSTPSTQPEEPVEAQPEEPVNAEAEVAPAEEPVKEQTALERIPQDRKGKPIFEKAESPELAWDALVEFAGDAKSAQEIAGMMVANKKRAYETADKAKPKGNDPSEILNSQRSINASKEKAKGEYEMWQKIAAEQQRREDAIESQRAAAARQEAAARAEAEKAEREAREEAERVEREALNGIPEWHMDTPQNARARRSRRHGGQLIKRQEEFSDDVAGNALEVKFSQNDMPIGHYSVIEADQLQPSHMDGQRNPLHFLDEAQPKDRSEAVSVHAARQIAENIRPEEITGSATAYTGAPTVNTRGEVIQGNNRSAALRYLWDNNLPEQQAAYKQYLIDNAERFGLNPEKIMAMKKPVLVNRLRVEDDEAIRLGQMTAQDTESGGIERIKPKNVAQKLGDEMRTFANLLLRGDEEATFGQLVDRNGAEVLRWMNEKGYISNTQYQSAFDSKGNLTAEAKNDLQKTLYQAVFRGGAQQLEEMFDKLPAKAQRAILATAFRDMDSPLAGKLLPEIQASIAAYVQLMNDPTFANAKNMEELLRAVETFKKATALDDRFETYVPADNFSNFALHLAAMYKANDMSQSTIASYFNRMYDLAQGKTAATLFEEADGTQYVLADIVKKVFDFEYKPAKNGNNNDNNGSLDVAVSNTVSQGGEPRGAEPPRGGEQNPTGAEPTDRGGRAESDSRGGGNRPTRGGGEGAAIQNNIPEKKEVTSSDPRTMPDDEKARRGDMLRNAIAIEVVPEQIVATKELSARKAAEQWWDENVPEPAFYDTEIGEVEINKNSIESSLAHKYGQMKLDAITSLIEGFENAVYLGTMPDFARQEGVNNHFFAYPIMYNGMRCYVFCRAMEDANKNRLYVHEVFVSDKIKQGGTLQTAASQPHGGIALYRDILANVLLSEGKITNSASNKQENGAESSEISEQKREGREADGEKLEADKDVEGMSWGKDVVSHDNYGRETVHRTMYLDGKPIGTYYGKESGSLLRDGREEYAISVPGLETKQDLMLPLLDADGKDIRDGATSDGARYRLDAGWISFGSKEEAVEFYRRNRETIEKFNESVDTEMSHEMRTMAESLVRDKELMKYANGVAFSKPGEEIGDATAMGAELGKRIRERLLEMKPDLSTSELMKIGAEFLNEVFSVTNPATKGKEAHPGMVMPFYDALTGREEKKGVESREPRAEGRVSDDEKAMLRRKWEALKSKMPEGTVFIVEHNGRYYAFGDDATRVNAALNGKGDEARTDFITLDEKQYNDALEVLDLKGFSVASYSAKDIKEAAQPVQKLEDFGEKIAGARKDALHELSSSIEDANVQSFVALPLSKAFRRPNIKKLVEAGVVDENEAKFIEAMTQVILGNRKPALTKKSSSKLEIEKWAQGQYEAVQLIKTFVEGDKETRAAIVERLKAEYERCKESGERISPAAFAYAVLERAGIGDMSGYKPVDMWVRKYGKTYAISAGKGYVRVIGENLDDAVSTQVAALQIKNGISDVDMPISMFKVKGEGRKLEGTGVYAVQWMTGTKYNTRKFNSKEEAEKFAATKKGSYMAEEQRFGGYTQYKIEAINPANHEYVDVDSGIKFDSEAEAKAYIEEHLEELSAKAVDKIFAEEKIERKSKQYFEVIKDYKSGDYMVVYKGTNWIHSTHKSMDEAQAEAERKSQEYADLEAQQRKIVYFSTEERPRVGKDHRGGKDATPEMFTEAFGFRGVQFGNWTNSKDRQEALNQAYDAFMDLAELLGKSPRAMSLNGELGLAFGARGSGEALAHYEPGEVVINLTKTKGAGSLAHEWWHALDNYFARRDGVAYGFACEVTNVLRDELREDMYRLMQAINRSGYGQRCAKMSSYWRSSREVTARLFAEYVSAKLGESGNENSFLSRGASAKGRRNLMESNWRKYQMRVSKMLSRYGAKTDFKPMTYDEFMASPEALEGYKYPTPEEIAELKPHLEEFINDIREDEGGAMFHKVENTKEVGTVAPSEEVLVDGLVGLLNDAVGIETIADAEVGQRVLDNLPAESDVKMEAYEGSVSEFFHDASRGIVNGKPTSIGVLTEEGRRFLESISGLSMKDIVDFVLNPSDCRHIINGHYGENEKDTGNNIPLNDRDLNNLSQVLSSPDKVVYGVERKSGRKMFFFLKDDGNGAYNLAEVYADRHGHLTTKTFYKTKKSSTQREHELLNNPSLSTSKTDGASSFDGAKVPKLFETQKIKYHKVYHGSGAEFEAFDFSHMGEGEGNQAYGWGGYVTEVEGIGRTYAKAMAQSSDKRTRLLWECKKREADLQDLKRWHANAKEELAERVNYLEEVKQSGSDANKIKNNEYAVKLQQGIVDDYKQRLADAEAAYDEAVRALKEYDKNNPEATSILYTVEVPEDNGSNYLHWEKPVGKGVGAKLRNALYERMLRDDEDGSYEDATSRTMLKRELERFIRDEHDGKSIYGTISTYLGSDKAASEFLRGNGFVGMSYPAQYRTGGRTDNARNFVIFNEGDMRITEKARFFRTSKGEAYGFTIGGKIYIDPRIATAETPIHEYAHLWAEALRNGNPKEWSNVVELMKDCKELWEKVKEDYPELKTDEDIAEEVLSHFSGQRGAERLRQEQRRMMDKANGVFEKAEVASLFGRIKDALGRFWRKVADMLHIHYTSAEEVADRVLYDLLRGFNPKDAAKTGSERVRYQIVGEKGAEASKTLEKVEESDIVKRAKADGTYMKAPNGKPSKLDERQWEQVRSKEFKNWFGDWEKAARIKKLRKSQPVSITGKEIEITDDYQQNKRRALEFGKRLQGYYTNADTGVTVQLQRGRKNGGINELLQHNYKDVAHIQSVAAIPQIIEKSIYIASEANHDLTTNPNVREYQHFVCGLKIGGEDYTVHSLIAVDKYGNRYYDHNLTHIEKTKLLDQINSQAVYGQGFGTTPGTTPTTLNGYKGRKLFTLLQNNSSQVVDENGEPRIVYHGTKRQFWAFDGGKTKGVFDDGLNYFSLDRDFSERWINRDDERQRSPEDNAKLEEARQLSMQHKRETIKPLIEKYGTEYYNAPEYPELEKEWEQWERENLGLDGMTLKEAKYDYGKRLLECYISAQNIYNPKEKYETEGRQMLIDLGIINPNETGRERAMTDLYASNGSYLYYERKAVVDELKRRGYDGILITEDVSSDASKNLRTLAVWDPTKIKSATDNEGTFDAENPDIRFREVEDEGVLTEFAEGKTVKAYRTMQVIDGELYSPMATKVGGKETPVIKLGVPEQSEEHPELIKGKTMGRDGSEYGTVVIDKGQGKGTLTVAYNPYAHASRTALNDQFTSAHVRPNLVTVETEIPVSELTSGYRANMAKNAVGEMSWHSGTVSGQLSDLGKPRRVILTRYDRPVRIVPYREVAEMIAKQLEGTDIEIPYNVVQPQVRAELERLGVRISEKASGTVGDEADFGKAEYVTDQQIERINARQKEMAQTSHEAKSVHAERLLQKLNTPVRIINDVNEITHRNAEMQERMRKSKGWFDPSTGEVVIVLSNNRNVEDVAATVFHEVVAHKGLREMLGEENYDTFCDEIYKHLNKKLKDEIDEETTRRFMNDPKTEHEKHRRVAIDEMFGRLSEKGFEDFTREERSIWMKLRAKVLEAINKFLGSLKLPKWVTLGDNELRYMLWRSHERLTGKSNYVDMARDVAKRNELGLANDVIFKMGDKPETFEARQRRAVEQRGVVMPGLNNAKVKVVEVPKHPYTGTIAEATKQAIEAAKAKYAPNGEPVELHYDNHGAQFDYVISNNAIEINQSPKHQANSANKGAHLALAEHIDEVINESIEVEEHPDYAKNENGVRDTQKINGGALMHRFYGAAVIDGKPYRIMTLMREDARDSNGNGIHAYEVQKIEVLDETPNTSNGAGGLNSELEASSAVAKLLKGIEKSYDKGKNILDESKKADESGILFRDGEEKKERKKDETEDIWQDQSLGFEERLTNAKLRLSEFQRDDKTLRNDAIEAINEDLTSLRRAMAAQKQFDKATVKRVADLARILIQNNYLNGMTSYEVKRLLSAVKNSVGHDDVKNSVQKVLDIMVDNQLRIGEELFEQLLRTKGNRVDSRGVVVQSGLDANGQEMLATLRDAIDLSEDTIRKRLDEALADMNNPDEPAKAANAENDYFGLSFALEYIENVKAKKDAEKEYREQLKNAKAAKDDGKLTKEQYLEAKEAIEEAIRKNKIDLAEALCQLVGRLSNAMRESKANARAFREAEKARIEEIRHNANSDMEGRKAYSQIKDKDFWQNSWVNNSLIQWVTAPLATFDQMLRMFGNKSANGEGYLWNRFMRGYVDCRNKELTGLWNKYKQMDQKAEEIFGKGMTWTDVIAKERKFGTVEISFMDGKEMRTFELTQGNMLAIYMWNKMTDGRMKLRAMGITEADVEHITAAIDPRFKQLGDWIQEEFLPSTREEYNATHKRMFGAPMALIEDYFPLKILKNSLEEKTSDSNNENTALSTKTGSVIKRKVNINALDITNTDALKLVIDHIAEMEHWNAFAEYKRDMNTLLTYKRFRNQVLNMQSIYGGGTELWDLFKDLCKITVGEYKPKVDKYEKGAVNFAKAVSASKISFRIVTAMKQLLSMPAYIPEVSTAQIAKSLANPYGDFMWCLENMPIFRERWHSRIAGDPRLLKTDKDWKMWRSKVLELASRYGMTPNAFVDAVTVSIGARAMYNTRLKRYLKEGYEYEDADARAKQDAVILFNQTQQSSEAPFLSQMQVNRTWFSVLVSVFRNASMSYTRQTYDALRNLKRNLTPGQRNKSVEFMTKQILRDWNIDPDNATSEEKARAAKAARSRFRRQIKKDLLRLAVFNCILPGLWVAGSYMPYLLFGDDDDKKEQMLEDVVAHTLFGGIEGFTLGDLMGNGLSMLYTGDKDLWKLGKDMPFVADIKQIGEEFAWGNTTEATADIVNLFISSITGVNPQTLTDVVAATMDICGDDPELSHETAIFVARVINCPRSQIEELYFDEIGLSGEEASKLTPTQLAERYAKYRVKRGAAPWSWDNEDLLDKYERRALRQIKERMNNTGDSEVLAAYTDFEERHNAIEKRLNELKPLKKEDYEAYVDGVTELREDPDYYTSKVFGILDDDLSDIAKMWLKAETPEQAALCCETMAEFREKMVWALQGENVVEQYQRAGAARSMLSEFRYRYRALQ